VIFLAKFYKTFSFWTFLIILGISVFFIVNRHFSAIEVKGVKVKRQDLEVTVTATSTGTVRSEVEVNITAQRAGRIAKLYVEEGDRIKAGDIIAELDTSEVLANLNKVKADLKKAEVDLENAKIEYTRKEVLFKESLITQQQFDDAKKVLSIAAAELERAVSAVDIAQLQYDYSFIKTLVDGVISKRPVEIGDTAVPGLLIASVVDPDKLYIEAPVDEADVGNVALGQNVRITMDAYLDKVFHGIVIKISPVVTGAKLEARTFEVRVSINEPDVVLKPGMSADIEIITDKIHDTLVVPSQAVIERGQEKVVYVAERGRARKRKVITGTYNWNFTEIKDGLKEGDVVIVTPDRQGLKEGVRIKVVNLS
jgi:RND family efflux transporter MFP subunit